MSDIKRNLPDVIITGQLKKQMLEIQINERDSVIKGLKQRLEDLKNIEEKRIILDINMQEKMKESLETEFKLEN